MYMKPTHRNQYLQWDSHHHLSAKHSVIITITHMAKTVCNKPELLQKGMDHLRKALTHCRYPKRTIDRVKKRLSKSTREESNDVNNQITTGTKPTTNEVKTKGYIVKPCTQHLCESIKKIYGKYGIQTHFKCKSTIKNLLVSPQDKHRMENKSGTLYWYQHRDLTCDEEYIGDTSRTFGERCKEPSPIHSHSHNTGHTTTQDNFQIIGREDDDIARTIKESIHIKDLTTHS